MKQIFTLILGFSIVAAFAQVPGYVPTNGLLAWWGFNGNGNDTYSSNNLTNYNSTYSTDRFNVANAAVQFNGTTQYQTITTPNFQFGQTSQFTISFWVFRQVAGYGVALMHGTSANNNFIWNFQTNTSTDIQFGTNRQGSAWTWAQNAYTTNQWNHIVGTFNNGAMTLHINGVHVATATYTHTGAIQTTLPIWFGRGVGGAYFNGRLDDVGMWNRVLTLAEIQDLYNSCEAAIAAHPVDETAFLGSTVKFGAQALGAGVNYRWQSNIGSGWVNVPTSGQYAGALTDSLTVSNLTMLNNNQQFRCLVSQGANCSDTSNSVTLYVCGEINSQPNDSTIFINNSVSFSIAHSDAAAQLQWQSDTGAGFFNLTNSPQFVGTNTPTLVINNATMTNHLNLFRCVATSGSCSDTSDVAELIVINNIGLKENNTRQPAIYPNPASQILYVELPNKDHNPAYEIYNMLGVCIQKGYLENSNGIQIENFIPGTYILRVENYNKIIFSKSE